MRRGTLIPAADRIGLSRAEAADYVGMSTALFDRLVLDGRMPLPKRVGGRTIWDRRRVEKAFGDLPEQESKVIVSPYADTCA